MVYQSWNVRVILLVAILGYLLGNIQTALIISRAVFRDDVRLYGSGNAGSTNMVRVYGKQYGILTFIGDAGKAAIAFFLGRLLGGALGLRTADPALAKSIGGYISMTAAVYGHCFPALYGFRGGKGAACCFAVMWCFCWQAALASTIAFVLVFILTKRVSLVSLSAAVLFSIFVVVCHVLGWIPRYLIWYTLACSLLVIVRHHSNIRRLIRGQEGTLDFNGKPLQAQDQHKEEQS